MKSFDIKAITSMLLLVSACERNGRPPEPRSDSANSRTNVEEPALTPASASDTSKRKQGEARSDTADSRNAPCNDASRTDEAATQSSASNANTSNASGEVGNAVVRAPDVVYVPTPQPVVDKMLQLAKVKKGDVVYDLGCGDGRIVVTAAKRYGAKAFGFDVDPVRVAEARDNVRKNGLEQLVTIEQKDIFTLDLSPASVVTLYLLPSLNVKLIPQLEKLRPGSRIVSHDFDMSGVVPTQQLAVEAGDRSHGVFLWTTPLKRDLTLSKDSDKSSFLSVGAKRFGHPATNSVELP